MVGSPYLIPGFIGALILCSTKNYYQAICWMIGVVFCASDQTFYTMLFLALVWTTLSQLIAIIREG